MWWNLTYIQEQYVRKQETHSLIPWEKLHYVMKSNTKSVNNLNFSLHRALRTCAAPNVASYYCNQIQCEQPIWALIMYYYNRGLKVSIDIFHCSDDGNFPGADVMNNESFHLWPTWNANERQLILKHVSVLWNLWLLMNMNLPRGQEEKNIWMEAKAVLTFSFPQKNILSKSSWWELWIIHSKLLTKEEDWEKILWQAITESRTKKTMV